VNSKTVFHYHVWFNLKPGLDFEEGISVVRSFLSSLQETNQIAGFELLRNTAASPKTKLLPFHALIVFADAAQFSKAFGTVRAAGIHEGLHGMVLRSVSDFQIEVFESIESSAKQASL